MNGDESTILRRSLLKNATVADLGLRSFLTLVDRGLLEEGERRLTFSALIQGWISMSRDTRRQLEDAFLVFLILSLMGILRVLFR